MWWFILLIGGASLIMALVEMWNDKYEKNK